MRKIIYYTLERNLSLDRKFQNLNKNNFSASYIQCLQVHCARANEQWRLINLMFSTKVMNNFEKTQKKRKTKNFTLHNLNLI